MLRAGLRLSKAGFGDPSFRSQQYYRDRRQATKHHQKKERRCCDLVQSVWGFNPREPWAWPHMLAGFEPGTVDFLESVAPPCWEFREVRNTYTSSTFSKCSGCSRDDPVLSERRHACVCNHSATLRATAQKFVAVALRAVLPPPRPQNMH